MNDQFKSSNMKNKFAAPDISESLLNLGLKPNLKGFNYIKEAIIIYPKLKFANKNIMDLYAIIAEYHNVTSGSVEKAIRHLLERTWYCENINLSHVIFDCPYINAEDVPKNSVFISTMAEILKYQLKNNQIISNTEILRC